ncbi:type II toxin-antitoxin system RelE/ParE family toxin [Marinobacterium litorale]|uniref:type II toxin-antitoxin system RelE/ParE family toxin n=1 Tax=Marinobacterium litorale TaxID=404770 RepID=UPI000A026B2A|nr:type II toxin-antitoxin system RelE/ParE family toxin [Marinobacterium litorale]
MKVKPAHLREKASNDVDLAIEYYLSEAREEIAMGFVDALEKGLNHIGRHPRSGSTFYAHELNWPGLKSWPLKRYPHLVFYMEQPKHIDVIRVLHDHRDLPHWVRKYEE